MQNNIKKKNTDPKNQIILFLFCRLTLFFSLSCRLTKKINLVLPNVLFLKLILCAVLASKEIEAHNHIQSFLPVSE